MFDPDTRWASLDDMYEALRQFPETGQHEPFADKRVLDDLVLARFVDRFDDQQPPYRITPAGRFFREAMARSVRDD